LRSLARGHTALCIKVLAGIAQNGESESARVAAAGILLDRGWGKAPTTHTGENGEGDIRVVVRHIVNGRDVPASAPQMRVIEARPLPRMANGEHDEP
jgi:hypothetical protein